MNPDRIDYSYVEQDRRLEKEEKLKKVQVYKKKNQKHPAFKR